ncbi:MAG TPA: hypothetical protein VGI60_08205 [Chthoniobacterales bacterium]|jgi:hypothetical protein
MASIDWTGIETQTKNLAETLLGGFIQQAVSDARDYKEKAEDKLNKWVGQARAGQITGKNLASLIRGEADSRK